MRFQCPECGGVVAVENSDLNTMVQCGHCSKIVKVPASRVAPGCLVGDFIIRSEIGRGGMGVVYLAHQISLDRPAALKVLSDQYANNAEFVVGFIKEARAAAKLNHPHIVQAYAVGEDDGIFYFAMENIDGETMKKVLKREKVIPVDQAISIIQQIAEALNYAWIEQKLIHRDIKPDNIMLTSSGRAKLADLGLARVAGDIDDSEDDEVMGTPQYISPEHLTGAPMDGRSDIYSLGATFYHFVTGRFPFEGKTGAEIAKKHITDPLIPPNKVNPAVPDCVSRIIEKMMAKNPIMRYQTAESLVDDLRVAKKMVEAAAQDKKTSHHAPHHAAGKVQHGKVHAGKRNGKEPDDRLFDEDSVSVVLEAQKKEQQMMKMMIPAIIGAVVLAAIVVIGIIWFFIHRDDKPKDPHPVGIEQQVAAKKKKRPAATPASREMNDILAFAELNKTKVDEVHARCEKFLAGYSGPENDVEEAVFPEFMGLFSRADELLIKFQRERAAEHRDEAIKQYLADIERKEREERERAERAEEYKRRREERERKQAERAAAVKEIREKLRESLPQQKADVMAEVFLKTAKSDFAAAKEDLDKVCEEVEKIIKEMPELRGEFKSQVVWLRRFSEALGDCDAIQKAAFSDGDKLANSKLQLNGKPIVIEGIVKGKLRYRQGRNMQSAIAMNKLSAETKKDLIHLAAEKLGKQEQLFIYALMTGDAAGMKAARADMSEEGNKVAKEYINNFRKTLKLTMERTSVSNRDKLVKLLGKIPEFKELF